MTKVQEKSAKPAQAAKKSSAKSKAVAGDVKVDIKDLSGAVIGSVALSSAFAQEERPDIAARVVRYQLAKRQAGTHQTRTIDMIVGTTKKPWSQKGTGRARQGSLRSPQFRGGATVFGPVVRSHAHDLPKKIRQLGLKVVLSSKLRHNNLVVLDDKGQWPSKTKDVNAVFSKLGLSNALIVTPRESVPALRTVVGNLPGFSVLPPEGLNVYDMLRHKVVVVMKNSVEQVEARLS